MKKNLPQKNLHWKYDLPLPQDIPTVKSDLRKTKPSPRKINDACLEINRSTFSIRGIGIFGGSLAMGIITFALLVATNMAIELTGTLSSPSIIFFIGIHIGLYWLVIPTIRMDFEFPRDEPIRFNHLRRKVYFYQYKFDRLFIFSRSKWGVKPEIHNWDDLIAEAGSIYAPGHGGLIENVYIAVRKPGTDDIIARYFFTHDISLGEKYWAIARLYMQQGPEALPDFEHLPRDWNNDADISLIRRFLPKVQWPADIDLESRTAPTPGDTP